MMGPLRRLLCLACCGIWTFARVAIAAPAPSIKGIDRPAGRKITRSDLQSSQPGRDAFQNCFVFPKFVIVEVDTGSKGADAISIRHAKKSAHTDAACKAKSWPGEIKLAAQENYFQGARSGVLFTRSADMFGNLASLGAWELTTGQQIFEAKYSVARDFMVTATNGKVSVEFHQKLITACSVLEPGQDCWRRIVRDNNITTALETTKPDCSAAIAALAAQGGPSLQKNADVVQLFAPVKIKDLRNPKVHHLNSSVLCNQTP